MMEMLGVKYGAGRRAWAVVLSVVTLLASCDKEELAGMEEPLGGHGSIVVCGGNGDITATTRYVAPDDEASGPQVPGTCHADLLEVYPFFDTGGASLGWSSPENYRYQMSGEPSVSVPASIKLGIMGRNAYADAKISILKDRDYIVMYNTALAYTEADRTKFTTSITNRTDSKIALNASGSGSYSTPELYYGVLHLIEDSYNPAPSGAIHVWRENGDQYRWYGNHTLYTNSGSASLEGRIFRIVSQVNLTVTEIPTEMVTRLELYADHYPVEITLNGTHGANYPVHAVTDAAKTSGDDFVLLDAVDVAEGEETATLSSFLLPSEVGMHLKMRVVFAHGEAAREFDLLPQTSQYLTGTDATAYNVVDASLKHGSDLVVYDGNAGKFCFYSYSNVRVNMNGAFNNIAAETGEANIHIEVDPDFEDTHHFDIK